MIQRTLFNKITLERIHERFAHKFPDNLELYLKEWEGKIQRGDVVDTQFFISIDDQYEMDGLLFYETISGSGALFALRPETAQKLVERAKKFGEVKTLTGDSESLKWV